MLNDEQHQSVTYRTKHMPLTIAFIVTHFLILMISASSFFFSANVKWCHKYAFLHAECHFVGGTIRGSRGALPKKGLFFV